MASVNYKGYSSWEEYQKSCPYYATPMGLHNDSLTKSWEREMYLKIMEFLGWGGRTRRLSADGPAEGLAQARRMAYEQSHLGSLR